MRKIILLLFLILTADFYGYGLTTSKKIREIYSLLTEYNENAPDALEQKAKINGMFLLNDMAENAIRGIEEKMSEKEKTEYYQLMYALLEKTIYEDTAKKLQKGTVNFLGGVRVSTRVIRERTIVRLKAEEVEFHNDYDFSLREGEYRVSDIYIDDASLIADYHNQFVQIVQREGISGKKMSLIERLRKAVDKVSSWNEVENTSSKENEDSQNEEVRSKAQKESNRPIFIQ